MLKGDVRAACCYTARNSHLEGHIMLILIAGHCFSKLVYTSWQCLFITFCFNAARVQQYGFKDRRTCTDSSVMISEVKVLTPLHKVSK